MDRFHPFHPCKKSRLAPLAPLALLALPAHLVLFEDDDQRTRFHRNWD